MWLGTRYGSLVRFSRDGEEIPVDTANLEVDHISARAVEQNSRDQVWAGTFSGTICYTDSGMVLYTEKDGLINNKVTCLAEDSRGIMWLGTWAQGISRYDGLVWQHMTTESGLPSDAVRGLLAASNGDMWICTDSGVARYREGQGVPEMQLQDVVTDTDLGPVSQVRISETSHGLRFRYTSSDDETPSPKMAYVYELVGHDAGSRVTRNLSVAYEGLARGDYTFRIQAVDHDLHYSEPVEVRIVVHADYEKIALRSGLVLSLLGLVIASGYGLRRRRDQRRAEQALMREMEEELQTAHDMQMGLMPKESPKINGFDISGRCIPANHVGGDLFQYFGQDGKISVCLSDVTGHAMDAAIPVVMFDGILDKQMELGGSIKSIFSGLNLSLHHKLPGRTFVCFMMGEFDLSTRLLRLANGACPSPYHFQAATGDIFELEGGAYPLGVRPNTEYEVLETQLQPGDCIVFCSDGIVEADNEKDEQFGFEKTAETIKKACEEGLSAEATIDRILEAVSEFKGDAPQSDDMTCVVVRVETCRELH